MVVDKSASAPSRAHTTVVASTTGVAPSLRAHRGTFRICAYRLCDITFSPRYSAHIFCSERCLDREMAETRGNA